MVTSLGLNVQDSWAGILSSKSGVKNITAFDTSKLPCKIGSTIPNFNPEDYIPPRDVRKMGRFIHFGIAAADRMIIVLCMFTAKLVAATSG
jgi:3-oxoacyl-[acyl-carrier-protein] synthase II